MKYPLILSLALGCGWLLCPEALTIAGNAAGTTGWLVFPFLAVAALLFTGCGLLLASPQLPVSANRELLILGQTMGTIPAISLSLAACLPLLVLAATALLVSSGYTFNEVFLYWFPNFGFAFLLLALLTGLQFLPERVGLWMQFLFVALSGGGLLFLSIYGQIHPPATVPETVMQATGFASFSPGSAALLLLLFVASSFPLHQEDSMIPLVVPILVAAVGLLLYFLWTAVSLEFVTPERLASSTIPYMTAARKILGETGRQIMGVVVISGTCGAINGLFLICRRILAALPDPDKKTGLLTPARQRWLLPPLFALTTGAMMATGLAGDELLEVLLRAALILWLLYFSLLCLSAALWLKRKTGKIPLTGSLTVLLLVAGTGLTVASDERWLQLILSIGAGLTASGLLVSCWSFTNKFFTPKPTP